MIHNRLEEVTYNDVQEELKREDLNNRHITKYLPKAEEVIRVLSDTAAVNFYIQTQHSIYHIWIGHNSGVDIINGDMTTWNEEEWNLITFGIKS